jgi:hypothetical protein
MKSRVLGVRLTAWELDVGLRVFSEIADPAEKNLRDRTQFIDYQFSNSLDNAVSYSINCAPFRDDGYSTRLPTFSAPFEDHTENDG